jgi:hypothetical protein
MSTNVLSFYKECRCTSHHTAHTHSCTLHQWLVLSNPILFSLLPNLMLLPCDYCNIVSHQCHSGTFHNTTTSQGSRSAVSFLRGAHPQVCASRLCMFQEVNQNSSPHLLQDHTKLPADASTLLECSVTLFQQRSTSAQAGALLLS